MYSKLMFLVIIYHLNGISSQGIGVLFNNTIILDNSTVNWTNFNMLPCFLQTTTDFYRTTIVTSQTKQNQVNTTQANNIQLAIGYTCLDNSLGIYCNVSSSFCDIANPCLNGAICQSNISLSLGYACQCVTGFSGSNCENDDRICSDDTCWNNGTCLLINTTVSGNNITTYECQCVHGYDGVNCQVISDMCGNITCKNRGICVSTYLAWSCKCIDSSLYSGIYCEDKSSALAVKEALSKSFAIVAIIALCLVVVFVMIMDVMKYVFHIDPVDRERHRLKMEKEKKDEKRFRKKKSKKKRKPKLKKKLFYELFSCI